MKEPTTADYERASDELRGIIAKVNELENGPFKRRYINGTLTIADLVAMDKARFHIARAYRYLAEQIKDKN